MSMKRSDGLNEAETIDAHKTLRCEGFSITYQLDGSHFEIKPPVELGRAAAGACLLSVIFR